MPSPGGLPPVVLGYHTGPPPSSLPGVQSIHVPESGITSTLARLLKNTAKNMENLGSLIVAPVIG